MRVLNVCRPVAEWRDPRHRRGIAGEVVAARHLESLGFQIEAHRFRFGHHDVDLVARRGHLVVFVEVKARASARFGSGILSIGWRRRRDLVRGALVWIARHGRPGDQYRFDVIGIRWSGNLETEVEWIEGAFFHVEK